MRQWPFLFFPNLLIEYRFILFYQPVYLVILGTRTYNVPITSRYLLLILNSLKIKPSHNTHHVVTYVLQSLNMYVFIHRNSNHAITYVGLIFRWPYKPRKFVNQGYVNFAAEWITLKTGLWQLVAILQITHFPTQDEQGMFFHYSNPTKPDF